MAGLDPRDLVYTSGNEHDPGDRRGRDTLTIRPDDLFSLENRSRGGVRTWAGTLEPGTVAGVVARLRDAGFPQVPRHPVPGGSALRRLALGEETAIVAWHAAASLPGYAEAFAILDGIVAAADALEVRGPVTQVALVTEGATAD